VGHLPRVPDGVHDPAPVPRGGDRWVHADVDGDGKPDLVLRHQVSGINLAVFLDGVIPTGVALLPRVSDTTWAIVGPR